ncbi:pulmonary surfactant-associated protein C-like [Bombina bombina]|uniref:pulmonary surfactant-associated protein C-like n=1 Tax=Bombina bombina TaxID=8345 RepID=UPI00235A54FF|nr:pulmonary surfactant-associated protein C-like [Bombina bombina]
MEKPNSTSVDLPPVYSSPPKSNTLDKKWILGAVFLVVMTIVIAAASLIGTHLNNQYSLKSTELFHQTQHYSDGAENIAAFFINVTNNTATVLFDYKRDLIAFKQSNMDHCFVMNMNKNHVPSLDDVINGMHYFEQNDGKIDNAESYNFVDIKKSNYTQLGTSINLLCNDRPVYWGSMGQ